MTNTEIDLDAALHIAASDYDLDPIVAAINAIVDDLLASEGAHGLSIYAERGSSELWLQIDGVPHFLSRDSISPNVVRTIVWHAIEDREYRNRATEDPFSLDNIQKLLDAQDRPEGPAVLSEQAKRDAARFVRGATIPCIVGFDMGDGSSDLADVQVRVTAVDGRLAYGVVTGPNYIDSLVRMDIYDQTAKVIFVHGER